MKTKLYTVEIGFNGDIYRVGHFCGKGAAKKWLRETARRFPFLQSASVCDAAVIPALCSPNDFTSVVGSV